MYDTVNQPYDFLDQNWGYQADIHILEVKLTHWGRDKMVAIVPKGPINNNPALVQISHYLKQWWLVNWRINASLGLNELRFEMLTVRGQQHSFSTHERVFLWKCQRFWDRKCLDLRWTRTPNLRIHAECSSLLSSQSQTYAVPFFNTGYT